MLRQPAINQEIAHLLERILMHAAISAARARLPSPSKLRNPSRQLTEPCQQQQ